MPKFRCRPLQIEENDEAVTVGEDFIPDSKGYINVRFFKVPDANYERLGPLVEVGEEKWAAYGGALRADLSEDRMTLDLDLRFDFGPNGRRLTLLFPEPLSEEVLPWVARMVGPPGGR